MPRLVETPAANPDAPPTPVRLELGMTEERSPYRRLCDELDNAIARKFGYDRLSKTDEATVKDADRRALLTEAQELLYDGGGKESATA
jgi:hypothetical protein